MSTPTTTTAQRSLITKLAFVMNAIEQVAKNGRNDFHKYDYATEADILKEVRIKLAEQKVFVFTSVDKTEMVGDVTHVHTLHTFVDGETGELFSVNGYGQGQDKGDKGGYKAMTGAMKYFLLKNFLIPTGDDPEQDDKPKVASKATPRPVPKTATPAKVPSPKAPPVAPATPAQLAEIAKLAKELQMDVQKDILEKMKIVSPSFDQAAAIYKRLREKLTKELDDATKRNA